MRRKMITDGLLKAYVQLDGEAGKYTITNTLTGKVLGEFTFRTSEFTVLLFQARGSMNILRLQHKARGVKI